MSSRALLPSSVRARTATLQYGEDAAGANMRALANDLMGDGGRIDGLVITVDGVATTIGSVSAGTARAPNGERIVLETAVTGLSLADTTNGAVNYVIAVYYETSGTPYATVTSGASQNTRVTSSARIQVLTEAQFNALPATSTDQSVNALDRLVVVGLVQAAGSGIAIPVANVSQLPLSTELRGVASNVGTTLPGLSISGVQDLAPLGTATLSYTASTGVLTVAFSTGGAGTGTSDLRTATGSVTVTGGSGHTLTIDVIRELLPTSNTSTTVSIVAPFAPSTNSLAPAGVIDTLLRALIGSAARSPTNPLGLSFDDIGARLASVIPGALAIGSGLLTSALGDQPRVVFPLSSGALTEVALLPLSTSSVRYARVYIGDQRIILAINARHVNASTTWFAEDTGVAGLRLTLNLSTLTLTFETGSDSGAGHTWSVVESTSWATSGALATIGSGLLTQALSASRARVSAPYNGLNAGDRTLLFTSAESGDATRGALNIYRVCESTPGADYSLELALNAAYTNGSGTPWSRVRASVDSLRITLSTLDLAVEEWLSTDSSPWAVDAWSRIASVATTGITLRDNITAAGFELTTAATVVVSFNPAAIVPTGWGSVVGDITGSATAIPDLTVGPLSGLGHVFTGLRGAMFPLPPLPEGAIINRVRVHGDIQGPLGEQTASVYRQSRSGVITALASVTDLAVSPTTTTSMTISTANVVDNDEYTYFVYIHQTAGGTTSTVYHFDVRYTHDTLTP